MPSNVTCPKCGTRQTLSGDIPADGLRHVCTSCRAAFLVKVPARAAAPPPPLLPDFDLDDGSDFANGAHNDTNGANGAEGGDGGMPLPDEFGPSGTIAMDSTGDGAAFEALDGAVDRAANDGGLDLDGLEFGLPRAHHPDLPAARDDMPLPSDLLMSRDEAPDLLMSRYEAPALPVAREDMPLPGDFLAPRESVPRPGDLPAPRESMPRPGDLPAPRESMPRPGDLPVPRESMPRPGDYPAPRESVPRPDDLLAPLGSEQLSQDLPVASGRSGARPANRPPARPPATPAAAKPAQRRPTPPPAAFDPFAEDVPLAPSSPLEPLDLSESGPKSKPTKLNKPSGPTRLPTPNGQAPAVAPSEFGLELEPGAATSEPSAGGRPLPFALSAATPAATAAGAARPTDDGYEQLAPITRKQAVSEVEDVRPPRRRLFMIVGAAGGLLMLATAGFLLLEARRSEPRPDEVLGPMTADLTRDHYPAYQRTADKLLEATGNRPETVGLRAAAAENLLVAFLARGGERSKLSQAEQIVTALPTDGKFNPYAARARALLAIAKGKTGDISGILGAEAGTPEGDLVVALRDVAAGKREQAANSLRRVVAARPERLVAHYLLGRMLEESSPAEAKKEYEAVVSRSGDHLGAQLGLVRLMGAPAVRLAAAEALLDKKLSGVPRAETGDAYVAAGRAAAALGRTGEASASYGKALGTDPQNVGANLALGEAMLAESRWAEALARFQAAGPGALKTAAGKFGLGGALVATGQTDAGLAQVRQAAAENPKDPRGIYYPGLAAELGARPDYQTAADSYRAALGLDRAFLPASLRLASLMQREGKPQEALAVLKRAEEAGAPAAALQIAWGQALILAKQPARAEEVFRKAVAERPKEVPPHVGLASALEAQGNRDAARQVLEKALTAMPDALGLREPLAAVDVALGRKDDAMKLYRAEIATGRASPATRVAMAKLALDLGRPDDAQAELDKVIEENPATPNALFTLARVWEARKDVNRALQEYRRALRFESSPELSLAFGRALMQVGKDSEAMTAFDNATALPEGLLERGRALYRKGDYERALGDFQRASTLAPRDARAWTWAGTSRDKLGEADKAADAWRTALKLAPDDSETHFRLGRFELDKGQVKSALDHLRKAAARPPEKPDWEAELYFQLGTAEATGGSMPAAVAAFQKYLDTASPEAPARPDVVRQIDRLRGR